MKYKFKIPCLVCLLSLISSFAFTQTNQTNVLLLCDTINYEELKEMGSVRYNKNVIKDYTEALKYDPENADLYNDRGVAYFNLGRYTSAIKDFRHAQKLRPNFEIAIENEKLAHTKRSEKTTMILNIVSAGLNATSATLNTINSLQQNTTNVKSGQPHIVQSTPVNSGLKLKQKTCTNCNGTGSIDGYVATFGNMNEIWCDQCQKMKPANHCHGCKVCPVCKGKKYTESYF